ncbi:hypothetical protein C8J57DRAFT_1246495 [Mycena rebaudengoi]|nr:hypothetical protein C8J57DRAFT_1246495 [Mycena rebaudengoi]
MDIIAVNKILQLTSQIAANCGHSNYDHNVRATTYMFCSSFVQHDGWIDVAATALSLGEQKSAVPHDVTWVYTALEEIDASRNGIESQWDDTLNQTVLQLLRALNDVSKFPKPSKRVLRVVIDALTAAPPISAQAFNLLDQVHNWFTEADTKVVMQEYSVWRRMGDAALKDPIQMGWSYIDRGARLSIFPDWNPYMCRDLPQWITGSERLRSNYDFVLSLIWGGSYSGAYDFMNNSERTWAVTLISLANVWESFNFSDYQVLPVPDLYQLAKCTVSTALKAHYVHLPDFHDLTIQIWFFRHPNFRAIFCTRLGDALSQAAINAKMQYPMSKHRINPIPTWLLEGTGRILEEMGQVLKSEPDVRGEQAEKWYWDTLRTKFEKEITVLEESMKEQQSGQVAVAAEVEMT